MEKILATKNSRASSSVMKSGPHFSDDLRRVSCQQPGKVLGCEQMELPKLWKPVSGVCDDPTQAP